MHRCLIIDASPIIRKVTRIILGNFGYEVVEASNGRDGLALYRSAPTQLVIVDARLTDMSTLDVLRRIRDSGNASVKVLYCTTEFDIIELQKAHAAGAHDVLVKPFDRATLSVKIDALTTADAGNERPGIYARLSRSELVRLG